MSAFFPAQGAEDMPAPSLNFLKGSPAHPQSRGNV